MTSSILLIGSAINFFILLLIYVYRWVRAVRKEQTVGSLEVYMVAFVLANTLLFVMFTSNKHSQDKPSVEITNQFIKAISNNSSQTK